MSEFGGSSGAEGDVDEDVEQVASAEEKEAPKPGKVC
jgi:hypothetical protein